MTYAAKNTENQQIKSYGFWQSNVSLEHVFSKQTSFSYPSILGDSVYYLTSLTQDKGRNALMKLSLSDLQSEPQCITPKGFNLRIKVNEYGGKPYWIAEEAIYFVNQADQSVYCQALNADGAAAKPVKVSPSLASGKKAMFTDVNILNNGLILAIMETEDGSANQNRMCLAALGDDHGEQKIQILSQGADFYSNLVINQQQSKIAWVEWQHPSMPWDDTQLYLADLLVEDGHANVVNTHKVNLPEKSSVCQLEFSHSGDLYFSMDVADSVADTDSDSNSDSDLDFEKFWNVYCIKASAPDVLIPISKKLNQEFGYPHWQYGDQRITVLDEIHMLVIGSAPEKDSLYLINTQTHAFEKVDLTIKKTYSNSHLKTASSLDYVGFQSLSADKNGNLVLLALKADSSPSLLHLSWQGSNTLAPAVTVLKQNQPLIEQSQVSVAKHMAYETRDGQTAYGFYYPPKNNQFAAPEGKRPPLIVMVHGGPTARSYGFFDIQKQFWTSRGFALFDVNHRGSSGYGRPFRDALYGHWGDMDIGDVVDGVQHLVDLNLVDEDKVCIRGKSAGGYAVLRALTQYPALFKVGACYYGIGNLLTLAEHTHKFEKHYTDRLIGETFDEVQSYQASSLFKQRSPINDVARIKSAMILFQGLDDKVVPPCVSQEVVVALKDNEVPHKYIEYEGEGHGFRQKENNIDAWSNELAFYQQVLS